jgi:hypothetical protein
MSTAPALNRRPSSMRRGVVDPSVTSCPKFSLITDAHLTLAALVGHVHQSACLKVIFVRNECLFAKSCVESS